MSTTTPHTNHIESRLTQLRTDIVALIDAAIDDLAGQLPSPAPMTPTSAPTDEDKLGEVAYLHWKHRQDHGLITVEDSRRIRRALYGDKMRATANLFGTSDENAPFYRAVPYGTRTQPDQEIKLTARGEQLAQDYAAKYGLA
ncbi:hypothetical protein [Kineococcus sp. SYSU DK006]|uniref:hypothetical protein n=1 Tax=Kineococcus sp. SYSU DK006 TaxID=3383127 RepID=UPI003D7E3B1E